MKRLGFVILLAVMVMAAIGLTAQLTAPRPMTEADRATFARANQLVEAGQVAAAVNLYEQLSAQGIVNADLLYNLGRLISRQNQSGNRIPMCGRRSRRAMGRSPRGWQTGFSADRHAAHVE
jgi:hypothetical protein